MTKDNNVVGWFEIYVDDIKRAQKFYETVFQITMQPMPMPAELTESGMEMVAFPMDDMNLPGAIGALVQMETRKAADAGTIVYFNCADCAVEESRVVAAGGVVVRSKESIGDYGYMALLTDSEGNTIGLHSMN